jgi:hypothetical protein
MTAPAPLLQALAAGPGRGYDRGFDWTYTEGGGIPGGGVGAGLVPVEWDGLPLNTGDQDSGLCAVVEKVDGWLDSPPVDGHDAQRSIADGAAWGPKTLGPRTIVITGAAAGPREALGAFRDALVGRAAARDPAELAIGGRGRTLTADVRAGTEQLHHTWHGPEFYRYQVTVTAADPCLYDSRWQSHRLTNISADVTTGRIYTRAYEWRYASSEVPNSGTLANEGNTAAPVFALYEGDLTESRLVGAGGAQIRLAPIAEQMQILVATATVTATAVGGLSRASFVLPGSRPITVAPQSSARWFLYSAGYGSVTLAWRSAWL